jgi:hypothetical protein
MDEQLKKEFQETLVGQWQFAPDSFFTASQRAHSHTPFVVRGYSKGEFYPQFFGCATVEAAQSTIMQIQKHLTFKSFHGRF